MNLQKQAEELMPKELISFPEFEDIIEMKWKDGYNQALADCKSQILAILQMIKKVIDEIPTEFPQYESDDMDIGAKKFKTLLLEALFNEN